MTAALHPLNHPIAHLDDAYVPDDVIPYDVGYDDMLLLQQHKMPTSETPVPGQDMDLPYRCPVSTPANFVHPSPRVRRTKPMPVSLEITLTPCSPSKRSAGGKPPRPGAAATHRTHHPHHPHHHQQQQQQQHQHHHPGSSSNNKLLHSGDDSVGGGRGGRRESRHPLPAPGMMMVKGRGGLGFGGGGGVGGGGGGGGAGALNSRSLQYYYVDKAEEQREAAETNTFWLKALCSQPVTEILDKYKRRSDLRRTRLLWSKTYTTPGEKSLLQAWERNGPRVSRFSAHFHALRAPSRNAPAPLSHPQSMPGPHTKTGSSASGARSGLPRHQSEPFDRSRGYPSDEGEDDSEDEEEEARMGSSTISADVTFSSPPSSDRLQSPRQRSPASGEYQKHRTRPLFSETEKAVGRLCPMLNGTNAHSAEPTYDLSEHFQVSLPSVNEGRRGRWGERPGALATTTTTTAAAIITTTTAPTTTPTTRPPFPLPKDRRPRPLGDPSGDLTSQTSEPSPRESTVSRGVASTPGSSTLPTDTPRSDSLYTTLPAIHRA